MHSLFAQARHATMPDHKQEENGDRQSFGELDLTRRAEMNNMTPEEAAAHLEKMEARRKEAEQQRLCGLVAELADWFQSSLDLDPEIYADPGGYEKFFESLQTGVLLGHVLEKCTSAELGLTYKFKPGAQAGSFPARDNVCLFVESCGRLGVDAADVFEVEDLISRKSDKAVVNCLLGLARIGYTKAGLKPPTIVQMEVEIDKEMAESGDEEEVSVENTHTGLFSEGVYKPNKSDPIDVALAREINELGLKLDIKRLGGKSGVYTLGGKKVHMRILRGQLLVRVGGGWTDLLTFSQKATTTRSIERQQSGKKILTLSTTSTIGDDGKPAHKESVEKKLVPLGSLIEACDDAAKAAPPKTEQKGLKSPQTTSRSTSPRPKPIATTTPTSSRSSRSPSPKPTSSSPSSPRLLSSGSKSPSPASRSSSPLPPSLPRSVSSPKPASSSPAPRTNPSSSSPSSSIATTTTTRSGVSRGPSKILKDKYGNALPSK